MINYEMALSEIEMYKKAHEILSENLTHANKKVQQFKEERDTLNSKYNNLTSHIRMKAETNPGVSRYIDLVNYIDRLERE